MQGVRKDSNPNGAVADKIAAAQKYHICLKEGADDRYRYSYPLVLTPLRSDVEVDFKNDAEAAEAIDRAVAEYNKSASASRTCPKELIDIRKYKRQLGVTLVAADIIRSPGRALRTLSLKLLEYDYFKKLVTDEHKLFTTIYEKFDEDEAQNSDDICVSNDVLLKAVTDVIFSPSEVYSNGNAGHYN